jgi:hypothetical protein
VLSASLENMNSTISMKAEGSGECNVVVYLVKSPHIFDTFKVRVSSVVKPNSPVQVHVGAVIKFKIMEQSEIMTPTEQLLWSSNNHSVIDINHRTGEAKALS